MVRLAQSNSGHLLAGIVRIAIILAVAAYGAAIVQNVNEVLHGIAHQQAPTTVVQRPVR
nr:hypothetical protein [uncultured Rhodopila sp.]